MAKPTVLIVDDDPEVSSYLREVLRADGWKVLAEKDGDWALKTFRSRRIDAVILDILIPVLNGFQVAEAIRKDPRGADLPIVIMSGVYRGEQHRQEAIERFGLVDYLNKPVEGAQVRRLLREALDRRDTERVRQRTGPKPRVEEAALGAPSPATPAPAAQGTPRATATRPPTATPAPVQTPQPLPRRQPPMKGTLRQQPFGMLLGHLYRLQATGGLFLMRDRVKKVLYFETGYPVFAKSNLLRESFGQHLVSAGVLSSPDRDRLVREAKAARRLLGQQVLAEGRITESALWAHLGQNLLDKVLDVFHWADGAYQFRENVAPPPGVAIALPVSPAMLIVQGVQAAYALERLEAEAASLMSGFPAPAEDPVLRLQRLDLPEEVGSTLETLDGRRTLHRILEEGGASRAAVLKVTLGAYYAGALDLYDRTLRLPPLRTESRRRMLFGPGALPEPGDPDVQEELAAEQLRLKNVDHFRALGLSRSASSQDVEVAFDTRAWRVHPDRFLGAPETQELAEAVFHRLRSAYMALRSARRRSAYLAQLAESFPEPPPLSPEEQARAEALGEQGAAHLRAGRYEEAAVALRDAVGLRDDVAEWHAHLALAVHRADPTDPVATRDARQHLERALQIDPDLDVCHLGLGYLALAAQELDRAREHFARAVALNPENAEAQEQLDQLQA